MDNLSFISNQDLESHVKATILKYADKLLPYDLKRLNKNLIDPIKLLFDKEVYRLSWDQIINNEIFRQRDKASNNDIGYFHQNIFKYFKDCQVPQNGTLGGWDVIFRPQRDIDIDGIGHVNTIYVEMKNKHNTMNSASASKTFIKMQSQLLSDDDCACFLVEAIAKKSQNIKWETSVDGKSVSHKLIRRVSLDKFYEIVTGEHDAFYKLCIALPDIIEKVISEADDLKVPNDSVMTELNEIAKQLRLSGISTEKRAMLTAVYLLGFSGYNGFPSEAR